MLSAIREVTVALPPKEDTALSQLEIGVPCSRLREHVAAISCQRLLGSGMATASVAMAPNPKFRT